MKIEVLYFDGCPHYETFATHLDQLMRDRGVGEQTRRVRVTTSRQAQELQFLGSPTLRINGTDVDPTAGDRTDYGMQCRLYRTVDGYRGMPPDEWILEAIDRHQRQVT